ncbi:MAG: flagellar M-ring protein FliF C-terminal domain-containing protein, partial [Lysobacter sp.]
SQNQEEAEFVHGTAREEISRAPGRVERLSIAVILTPSLDEQQVARIHSLIAAAAGINIERGDRLEVSRLGRDERWRVAPSGNVEPTAAPSRDNGIPMIMGPSSAVAWLKWLPFLALGLLLGVIAAIAVQRRPRALKPSEREAVLAKLRGWLADGTVSP